MGAGAGVGYGCGWSRGGGGVERAVVGELEVWMELELEMKLGYVGAYVA